MRVLFENPAVLVGVFRALLILLVTFGVALTQAQTDSVLELVGSLLAVISLTLTAVTAKITTPKEAPTLPQGTVVKVVTPAGQPDFATII